MRTSKMIDEEVVSQSQEVLGKLEDLVFGLQSSSYPSLRGIVVRVGGRSLYVPATAIQTFDQDRILLAKAKVDLRGFERREGEVLLQADLLGHRLIDIDEAQLVWAWDVEVEHRNGEWLLTGIVAHRRPSHFLKVIPRRGSQDVKDWKTFEPLIGHSASAFARAPFKRMHRLKPAQIADLIEEASHDESAELMVDLHRDPELEADVYEELDPETANRLFGDKPDEEVADVIARMQANDAADAIGELPQERRRRVLDLLPHSERAKIMNLMSFNASSAGGIMSVDYLVCDESMQVGEVAALVRTSEREQIERTHAVFVTDAHGVLRGVATMVDILRADPTVQIIEAADRDCVSVAPLADIVDIALVMTDFNLISLPVVDDQGVLVGVVTVDDVLEATLPDEWRAREPSVHIHHRDASTTSPPGPGN